MSGSRAVVAAACLVAMVSLVAVGGAGAQGEQVTIRVTVVDGDGDPVSGATVSATWADERVNATTHSSGEALVDVPRGANVSLMVHDDSYVRNAPYRVANASQQAVTVGVLEQGRATITVRDDSGPVERARVQLYRDGRLVVDERTGDASAVTTKPIAQGTYTLAVFHDDRRHEETVEVGQWLNRTVVLGSSSAVVTFDVTDGHFDPPRSVANATVSVDGVGTARTLADGQASVRVPTDTELSVTVRKDGYGSTTLTPYVAESAETVDVSLERTPALTVRTSADSVDVGESVAIAVTNEYGRPVGNATLTVGGEAVASTDPRGEATVTVDAVGDVTVAATTGERRGETTVEGLGDRTTTRDRTTVVTTGTATLTNASASNDGIASSLAGPGFTAIAAVVALVAALALALAARRPNDRL